MNCLLYRWKLRKYQRQRDQIGSLYAQKIEKARREGKKAELEELIADMFMDLYEPTEEIGILQTKYLRKKAEKIYAPFPKFDKESGLWEQGSFTGEWYLSKQGFLEAGDLINRKRKQNLSYWLPIMTTLAGLLSALAGVLALLKSF